MIDWERRSGPREDMARPCKIFIRKIGRYLPGMTWNLSTGGVLIQTQRLPVQPGDRLCVGVSLKRRQAVLPAGEMLEGEIVRIFSTTADRMALAVRFLSAVAAENRAAA